MHFNFPIPPNYDEKPLWNKSKFTISGQHLSVIKYTENLSGWNNNLTFFHEEEAYNGNHYIDKASRNNAISNLKKSVVSKNPIILEVGSSSGYFLHDLKLTFTTAFIIGSDCIAEPLEKLAKNVSNIPLIQFDLNECPLPDNSVDAIVLLNVLEHIEDDQTAINQLYRILKPNGTVIIEVPANPDIYDFYDEYLKHYRRYTLKELIFKSKTSGFTIRKASHLGFFLYPIFMLTKKYGTSKKNLSDIQKQEMIKQRISYGGKIGNMILTILMNIELMIGNFFSYPIGIRCTIVLKK